MNHSSDNEDYFNLKENEIHSTGFKIGTALLGIFGLMPAIMGYLGIKGYYLPDAPCWFLNIYFWSGIVTFASAYAIYKFRKFGVYLYVASVLFLYILFLFAYGKELHDSFMALFVFIAVGLFVIIPRWKYFK